MKTSSTTLVLIAGLFLISFLTDSCAKPDHSTDMPKEQLVLGKWNINRIQLKIYTNGVFIKDTIVKQEFHPENFVKFDAGGTFEYRFNSYTSDLGTFQFVGADSLVSSSSPKNYRWKCLTLTTRLFTVMNTTTDPAYPGSIVEVYQTFVH